MRCPRLVHGAYYLDDYLCDLLKEFMELIGFILLFVASLFALVKASDWFIGAAEAIGLAAGISPFVIGVTFVAFGTSLPELATSVASIFEGSSEIVLGNVVGSNVTNILLILGLTAVVGGQIVMNPKTMDNNILMLLASTFMLWFTVVDRQFSFFEAVLFALALVFFILTTMEGRDKDNPDRPKARTQHYLLLLAGGALVYLGARFTIFSLIRISEFAAIPSEVIAVTAVALGTSLPEVAVSISAVRKGKSEIAVGNILGSNVFNTFAVMSASAFFGPLVIPESILGFGLPVMIAVTVMFCFMFLAPRISKWEGMILLLFYAFFIVNSFTDKTFPG